ncbi:L-fucose:H+ symporter permease [Sediminitomix flava]|uniref:FHS family L-fucose permease-like MFS transporter n=1 Tax=Sediminitomix flava TaxID=379075 RepID=A0A315Z4W3_SEDFL|nr:L-fucose:H+ symporter permease [Sediminitomix flava]PWJ37913.1 FHS family L-fucose permease-like MFS transporter [Sediminitomix flava]
MNELVTENIIAEGQEPVSASPKKVIEKKYLLPFVLITSLFALWGFANDITNPMVSAFQTVMEISTFKASLVQFAFYGGYFTMALPAALFVKKYSYKTAILIGLGLYATGALLFIPAAQFQIFGFFLVSLYILTFGLAFLETTANPLVLSLGAKETATRRLNLAQSFNPIGSLAGMFVAQQFILSALQSAEKNTSGDLIYTTLDSAQKEIIKLNDLMVIRDPYVFIGIVVIIVGVVIAMVKIPEERTSDQSFSLGNTIVRLVKNKTYKEGVIAQVFYVGAQIMCWTFIIQYAENLGYTKAEAQSFNIIAMVLFLSSRFIATALMKYLKAAQLLTFFAIGGIVTMACTIFIGGDLGLYALIATSAFMSLMFPTIYGISLEEVGDDSEFGAAGLVMAIVGGALMPPMQGAIIDMKSILGMDAVNASFIIPLLCFCVIAVFGYRRFKQV